MAIGHPLNEAPHHRGRTQEAAGQVGYVSNKMVSAIECGRRAAGPDVIERLATTLDYPKFYMEAAAEVTGRVYASPWLDGSSVDLHRTSVWAKTCEELQEAIKAVASADVVNAPSRADETHRQAIHDSIMQTLDARVAIDHYMAVMCEEYGFSILAVYQEHRQKLENRGYAKPRPKRKSAF
jgi:transcriptional regulator with XRE-family HTH domain